jgi:hypothetical protein
MQIQQINYKWSSVGTLLYRIAPVEGDPNGDEYRDSEVAAPSTSHEGDCRTAGNGLALAFLAATRPQWQTT